MSDLTGGWERLEVNIDTVTEQTLEHPVLVFTAVALGTSAGYHVPPGRTSRIPLDP